MKISKDILLAVVVSAAILFGWEPFCRSMGWIPDRTAAASRTGKVRSEKKSVPATAAHSPAAASVPASVTLPVHKHDPVILDNGRLRLSFSPDEGMIESATLDRYRKADRKSAVSVDFARSAGSCGALAVSGSKRDWKVRDVVKSEVAHSPDGNAVYTLVREMENADGRVFTLSQTWTLYGDYHVDYVFSIRNDSGKELRFDDVIVHGGNLASWNAVSGDTARIPSHRLSFMTPDGDYDDIKADKKHDKFMLLNPPRVAWCAVSNKYFCSILDAEKPFTLFQAQEWTRDAKPVPVIAAGARLGELLLAPESEKSFAFRLYAGPKILDQLQAFNPSTDRVMHLAWGPLDYLARLLLWLLVKMNALFGSYGVSIIVLTLIVRLVFYPITAKANASMKKMQTVQPKLKELREKYKDNPQLMNAKMMELYRQEGVNPFGGCLPILFQIPIFFALYQMLDGAIQLRQESFLWCRDLAQADTVARIPLYFTNLPINPLVIAMTVLMLIQQKLTPAVGDPVQRKMMMFMPIAMLLFLYDLPSGLTLYWTVSNAFSIFQLQLQKRNTTAVTASAGK